MLDLGKIPFILPQNGTTASACTKNAKMIKLVYKQEVSYGFG